MKQIIGLLILSFALSGCPQKKLAPNPNEMNKSIVAFASLYSGNLNGSGEIEAQNIVIPSEEKWKSITKNLDLANELIKDIDFDSETLIIVIDTVRNTGGFSIKVDKVEETDSQLLVTVKNKGPKPTDMVTMAITQPFEVVKIRKTDKEIIFN